jgi:CDP-paratose 2-epimerase
MSVLVFGGTGFIGFHVARHYLAAGAEVHVADNLWRSGARANLAALEALETARGRLHFHHADIRHAEDVVAVVKAARPELVVHEAAQVAVTTSVTNPRLDFEINALGTFNVLEAIRTAAPDAFVIYASTNKVYGGMEELRVRETPERYEFVDIPEGVDESRPLDFHSPYACSKGAADQYVHDYHRIFGLRTAVFRQSCIYGTHQYGIEDQGWIAWFTIAHVLGRPITVYGNGKQVRDVLWAEDLVNAYDKAWKLDRKGAIYNMGGGAENTLSLLELLALLEGLRPTKPAVAFGPVRPGDQPVYIANAGRARAELDWRPLVKPADGVARLLEWVDRNQAQVARILGF